MPHQPSWLLRVNEILEDLSGPELSPIPFLSRAAIESLFRLRRRQAIHLMHAVGGFQVGKAFVVARSDLLRWLRRASLGEQVWWEQARHARVEHAIEQVRHERQARQQRALLPPSTLHLKLEGLPPSISIHPGELRIAFQGADDLFRQLFQLAQAMKNDYPRFQALAGG